MNDLGYLMLPGSIAQLTLDNQHNLRLIHEAKLQMLEECGYAPTEDSFKMLMAQRFYYKDDLEFQKSSIYMRMPPSL